MFICEVGCGCSKGEIDLGEGALDEVFRVKFGRLVGIGRVGERSQHSRQIIKIR
jgi:hypothetical protein